MTVAYSGTGCKRWQVRHKQRKELREIEKKRREKEKAKQQKYQEAVKHQADIQDRRTKRDMKRRYKKAERYNRHKKEFFLKRWFKGKGNRKAPQKRGRA